MFHRIRSTSHAVAPPVVHGSLVNRCIFHFFTDQVIKLLQRNHMQGNVRSITAVELFHRIRDRRIDRCIVGKDAGNAGDIKIIRIAVFFILRNAARRKPFLWLLRILILLCPMPFSMCRIISPNRSPSRKWLRPPVIMSATSPSFSRSRWAFPPDSSFRRKNPIRLPSFSHPRICQSLKSQTLWDSAIPFIFPAFSKNRPE